MNFYIFFMLYHFIYLKTCYDERDTPYLNVQNDPTDQIRWGHSGQLMGSFCTIDGVILYTWWGHSGH